MPRMSSTTDVPRLRELVDALTSAIERDAAEGEAQYEENLRRGVPNLSMLQSRILETMVEREEWLHAYMLAQYLEAAEVSIRHALSSLIEKGLIEFKGYDPSPMGPPRKMFGVVSPDQACIAIAEEQRRRKGKINQLAQQLTELTR